MGVVLTGSAPRFPLAPIPTLVPQAKPSTVGLEPPTPSLMTTLDGNPTTEVIDANICHSVGGIDGTNGPTISHFSGPTPYPSHTNTVPHSVASLPVNSTISSLPVQDSFSLRPSENRGRDETTDMFEVGRFASIVYPKRRWKGFASYGGTQRPAL